MLEQGCLRFVGVILILIIIELSAQTNAPKFSKSGSKNVPNKGKQKSLAIGMFFLNTCQLLFVFILLFKFSEISAWVMS